MRFPSFVTAVVLILIGQTSIAQNLPGVSFKRLYLDYQTLNEGDFWAFRNYTGGLEFSFLQPLMEDRLLLDVPVKIGAYDAAEDIRASVIGADLHLNYFVLDRARRLSPYVLAGIGAVLENKDSVHMQIPVGFGLDLRIAPRAYVNWQSEIRFALKEDKNNLHHSVGFRYFIGRDAVELPVVIDLPPADRDGDGIPDNIDRCPDVFGLAAFDGCPDTDNDGIPDYLDDCPDYPGLPEFNGCPDSDGDGIPDTEDECPHEPGTRENRGCPPPADRDGDGFPDDTDRCPDIPGTIDGCPDTDGDGIPDIDDKCPTMAGPASNDGCPVIEEKDRETLEFAMRAVQFEHGSARLLSESHRILNQVVDIMSRYPDFRLEISGHTDNTGADAFNMRLSQDRAKACYDYLVSRGISSRRMSYTGYGRTRPIADNKTQPGRQLNRRVEFNLVPGQ
jgi:OmpA-OmpF porin, OOP family